jgi:hypothetical protein
MQTMDKLKLAGQNLGRVFNSMLGCACICRVISYISKQPNLQLKTRPRQLLDSLSLAFALPVQTILVDVKSVNDQLITDASHPNTP